jgi:hypothetical protein
VDEDEAEGGDGSGVVTGSFQLGECVPDRGDHFVGVGV